VTQPERRRLPADAAVAAALGRPFSGRWPVREGPVATVERVDGLLLKTVDEVCRAEPDVLAYLQGDPFCATVLVARVGERSFLGSWVAEAALGRGISAAAATAAVLAFHARHPAARVPAAIPRWDALAAPLPAAARRRVAAAVAALAGHGRVLVHGDWLPQHAVRLPDGRVAAIDFGCAHVGFGVEDLARFGAAGPYTPAELRAGRILNHAWFYGLALRGGLPGASAWLAALLAL
jgi:Ser/Thr protein kinase RdoA (MazF antagonist)